MVLNTKISVKSSNVVGSFSDVVRLADGKQTTVHGVRYRKDIYRPRLVFFDKATRLTEWCRQNEITEAVSGGYYKRSRGKILGEGWYNSAKLPAIPFPEPWNYSRGCVYISRAGRLSISPRDEIPQNPDGDLLKVGPLLVRKGISAFDQETDPEGFSATASQHDEDLNSKRFPRLAIGMNNQYIWTVSADGRSPNDAGLFLPELAQIMQLLGADSALNLDGGRCATQITQGRLLNVPRSDYTALKNGYKIHNAIIFTQK